MALGIVASIFVVRRLGLPLWWLLFPPLTHAMWNGNSQTVALALLLVTGPILGPIAASAAVALKLYAALPLLTRWRDLVIAGVVLAVLLLVLPWQLYLTDGSGLASHLSSAWNGSAWRFPLLLVPTIAALWVAAPAGRGVVRGPDHLARDPVLLLGDGAAGARRAAGPGRGIRAADGAAATDRRHRLRDPRRLVGADRPVDRLVPVRSCSGGCRWSLKPSS